MFTVLTAAHCVLGMPPRWKLTHVRLGEWDTSTTHDCDSSDSIQPANCSYAFTEIPVDTPVVHENFSLPTLHHDIALIPLKQNVEFTVLIQPICLPLTLKLRKLDFFNKTMLVAGWGKTQYRVIFFEISHIQIAKIINNLRTKVRESKLLG